LSRISGSFVIGRHTAFTYKGKAVDLKQVGRELNVRYVLEGSVQRSGNRLRVNVQLNDAETGNHLWAERFDKAIADLFDVQDEIVSRLANTLNAQLIAAEARRAERSLHPNGLDLYFQGVARWNKRWTPEHMAQARRNATQGDMSMEWLKSFMTERGYRRGDRLFKKDDAANEMFLTVTGKFLVKEIGVELPPGRLMGELGLLTPNNRRTATVECIDDGQVLTITYDRLLELYIQNPQFGYYFLILTSQRLLENIARLVQQNAGPQTTAAGDVP
jgi:hypothetical protein